MRSKAPIFIGGAGRSGTTLLADLLGMTPSLSPVYETDFILSLAKALLGSPGVQPTQAEELCREFMDEWSSDLPHLPDNKAEHERFVHGPHHVLFSRSDVLTALEVLLRNVRCGDPFAAFRSFIDELFELHARLDGKPRWVNKTPAYVLHGEFLRRVYPEMLFLHCVRDGRDVACSIGARFGKRDYEDYARWWQSRVRIGEAFANKWPAQVKTVRYEDLLVNPVAVLAEVLEFIGEESEQAASLLEAYTNTGVELDPSRTGRWRERFTEQDDSSFREIAGRELDLYGYSQTGSRVHAAF